MQQSLHLLHPISKTKLRYSFPGGVNMKYTYMCLQQQMVRLQWNFFGILNQLLHIFQYFTLGWFLPVICACHDLAKLMYFILFTHCRLHCSPFLLSYISMLLKTNCRSISVCYCFLSDSISVIRDMFSKPRKMFM